MRSLLGNKRLVLLLAVLALLALTVLATSLEAIPFRAGQRFAQEGTEQGEFAPQQVGRVWAAIPIWKQLVAWSLISLLLVLVGMLVSPEIRKRMLMIFIRSVFTFWAVYFLLKNYGDRLLLPLISQGLAPSQQGEQTLSPAPVFEPPQVSPALSYAISFACALVWMVAMWAMYRGWKKYVMLHTKRPLEEIAKIARTSLADLSSGRDTSDVIINCYLRMSDVVSEKQKLSRAAAMTPREFALRLEQAGLPGDAVSRLTRLFEMVRYGDRRSSPREVNEAVSCLQTILHYCGEPV